MQRASVVILSCLLLFSLSTAQASTTLLRRQGKKVPGSYLVMFEDSDDAAIHPDAHAGQLEAKHGVKVQSVYRTGVKGFSFTGTEAQAVAIASDRRVKLVEEDGLMEGAGTRSVYSWGLDRIDQAALPLDGFYTSSYDGTGVAIYILDSGINEVPDISGRIRLARNFAADIDTLVVDPNAFSDVYNHGTPIAAIAAGTSFGIASAAQIINLRVSRIDNSARVSDVVSAIDFMTADHLNNHPTEGAVANMSFTGPVDPYVDAAVMRAVQAGITVIVAAGNNASNQNAVGDACLNTPAHLGNPSQYPSGNGASVITVGAIGGDYACTSCSQTRPDEKAAYSAWGQCVDVFAPGSLVDSQSRTGTFFWGSGTSFAAPHVAGVAALLMQRFGLVNSPSAVEGLIKDNASGGYLNAATLGTLSPNFNGLKLGGIGAVWDR